MNNIILYVLSCIALMEGISGDDSGVVDLSSHVDCSSSLSIIAMEQKCLDLYNIPVKLPPLNTSNTNVMSKIMPLFLRGNQGNFSHDMCNPSHQQDYEKALDCMIKISEGCTRNISSLYQIMFPSPAKIKVMIQEKCSLGIKYNESCVMSKMQPIEDCANASYSIKAALQPHFVERALCSGFQLARICTRKYLIQCGEAALKLYESGLNSMEPCSNYTDPSTGINVGIAVDCGSKYGIRSSYESCLARTKTDIQLPDLDTSDQMSTYIINKLTLDNIKDSCGNITQYMDAVNCTLTVQKGCSSDALQPTLPYISAVQTGIQIVCKEITGFDPVCIKRTSSSACGSRKRRSLETQILLKHICQDTKDRNKCLVGSLTGKCSTTTQTLYSTILKAQLPAMCQPVTTTTSATSTIQSSATSTIKLGGTKPSVDNNSARSLTCSFVIIIASLLLQ